MVDPTADRTITLPNVTGTVVTTGDTGTVTSTMILDGTIVDGDINASAAIVDTKLATIATAGKVSNSATTATSAYIASTIVARDASGNFSAGSITASLNGIAAHVITNANLTGDVTSVGNATAIAAGVIVDADVNASAAIADTKLATIATAGKVSNSATTAASANTASAIVARDASGNFTAGTITAALTGAASSNVLKAGDTMTGVLAVTAGTAALPGIATSGYLGTGIYSPSPNQLGISTNGASRIVVSTTAVSSTLPVAINGATSTATLSLPAGSNINAAGVNLYYDTNSAYSSGADRYIVNGVAARYIQDSGAHVWQRAASGTAGNPITFLEGMKLDDNGRLLVGTSSDSGGALFQVNGDRIRIGTAKTPASASATGAAGEICWDASYIYVCTATNTWKRTAIATW